MKSKNGYKGTSRPENTIPRATLTLGSEVLGTLAASLVRVPGMGFLAGVGLGAASIVTGRESEAEAFARSQKATAERLANEQRIEAFKDKQAKDDERMVAARREIERIGVTDEQKITNLLDEAFGMEVKIDEAKKKGAETIEIELQMLAKFRAAKELDLSLEKRYTEEAIERFREGARELDKYRDLARNFLTAGADVTGARNDRAGARKEAVSFTVVQAASRERGNSKARSQARKILSDEATARRLHDSGLTIAQWDPRAGRFGAGAVVRRGWEFFQNRALQMRNQMDGLNANERNPFGALESKVDEANRNLADIKISLRPADTGTKR